MSYRSNVQSIEDLIRAGDFIGIRRRGFGKWEVERFQPLSLAVSLYLKNFTASPENRYKKTLEETIKQVSKSGASMFPNNENALRVLAREAASQSQYDAVAQVFRKRAPNHFKRAHWIQYVNTTVANGQAGGRLSRASSFLHLRGINASQNRPKTSGGRPLGTSRIRNNLNGGSRFATRNHQNHHMNNVTNLPNLLASVSLEKKVKNQAAEINRLRKELANREAARRQRRKVIGLKAMSRP